MNSGYSFLQDPILAVLNKANSLLPNIENVISIHYCNEEKGIAANQCKDGIIERIEINENLSLIQKYRNQHTKCKWINKDEVPFKLKSLEKGKQIDIFNEIKSTILQIRIPNEDDGLYDLLFIYFNEKSTFFGLSKRNNPLTTSEKDIISQLLFNSINTIIETCKQDKRTFLASNNITQSVIRNATQTKTELNRTKQNYQISLINLCKHTLEVLSNKYNKNYILTENALKKIGKFSGNINNLTSVITDAVEYANTINYSSKDENISISEWYINFDNIDNKPTQNIHTKQSVANKYTRTIKLLDKLEQAALKLKNQNINLTSKNVGQACPTPISAPAISDALKKHKQKILYILKQYPDKWKTIRNNFKPIANIMEDNNNFMERIA